MIRRFVSLSVLLLLTVVMASVQGQEDKDKKKKEGEDKKKDGKVSLKWKFEKDKAFYQTMTTETTQTMKVMSQDVTQKQNQTFYFSWKPIKDEGGVWTIEQEILGVKMDIDIGNQKIAYDSTSKENKGNNPLSDFIQALVGQKFTLKLDTKEMKVTEIKGRDEFLEKLTKANPQMKPLLNQILSDEALKQMAEPTFAAVPNKDVAEKEEWKKESKLNMGPIGSYTNNYTYTYAGKDGDNAKIDVATTLTYTAPSQEGGTTSLPFKIKSADLTTKNAKGTILFDPAKGRIASSDMSLELTGKLSIEIGGQTTTVDLSQTQSSKVETSDKNPVEEAKPAGS